MQFTFNWTPEISVHNEHLDKQHQQLLGAVNDLLSAIMYRSAKERIEDVLGFLDGYIRTHLADEEEYMQKHNYPRLAEHKAMHEQFNAAYAAFKEELEKDGATDALAMRVQTHIGQWWMNHIGKADQDYAKYIAAQ